MWFGRGQVGNERGMNYKFRCAQSGILVKTKCVKSVLVLLVSFHAMSLGHTHQVPPLGIKLFLYSTFLGITFNIERQMQKSY